MNDDHTMTNTDGERIKRGAHDLVIGRDVIDGRYKLTGHLGEGGMGQVFEAEHLAMGRLVAVKILRPSTNDDIVSPARFRREIEVLVQLKHENLIQIFDAGTTPEGLHYLVMEKLDGDTLSEWIEKTELKDRDSEFINQLLMYMVQALNGVQKAHDEGIIHRDVKANNIFLHEDKHGFCLKVLDFSIARFLQPSSNEKLTRTDVHPGTNGFVAPEIILGDTPDHRADVFSFGVLFYEALTDRMPFAEEGDTSKAGFRVLDDNWEVVPPHMINANVSQVLSRICLRAIERDPEKRYESLSALRNDLADEITIPEENTMQKDKSRSSAKYVLIAGIVLIVFSVALTVWNYSPSETSTVAPSELDPPQVSVPEEPAITQPTEISEEPEENSSEVNEEAPQPVSQVVVEKPLKAQPKVENRPESKPVLSETPNSVEELTAEDKGRVKDLIQEGKAAFLAKEWQFAAALFKKATTIDPRAAEAWFGLARARGEQRRFDEAAQMARAALKHNNKSSWRLFLGRSLMSEGNRDGAIAEWKRVLCTENQSAREKARKLLMEAGVVIESEE